MAENPLLTRIYDAIYESEDARACRDIADSACVVVPGNFVKPAAAAFTLQGLRGGITILSLVVVFSLTRGFCSVALKDVPGNTVPKERRGQSTGLGASAAGLGVVCFAYWLWQQPADEQPYGTPMLLGGALWLLATVLFATVQERPGATDGGRNGLKEAFEQFAILGTDANFRRFVTVRALLVGSALMAPFLVVLTEENTPFVLSLFLLAQGAASLLNGIIWGRFADCSSCRLLAGSALAAAALGIVVCAVLRLLQALLLARELLEVLAPLDSKTVAFRYPGLGNIRLQMT